jgi:hypothetical protein
MNEPVNLLLYSERCQTCKQLFAILKNERLFEYFKLICIDDKLDKLPPQIKSVPTMIVQNFNKPLEPIECFKFVKTLIDSKKTIVNTDNDENKNKQNQDFDGFNLLEHTSFSDIYTHVVGDIPYEQDHFKYGNEKNHKITTPMLDGKLNQHEQMQRINKLSNERQKMTNDILIAQRQMAKQN